MKRTLLTIPLLATASPLLLKAGITASTIVVDNACWPDLVTDEDCIFDAGRDRQ